MNPETPERYLELVDVDLAALKAHLENDLNDPLIVACQRFGIRRHHGAIAEIAGVDTAERYNRYRTWKAIRRPFDNFGAEVVQAIFADLSLSTVEICDRLGISYANYKKICAYFGFTSDERKAKRREIAGRDPVIANKKRSFEETLSGDGRSLEFLRSKWK